MSLFTTLQSAATNAQSILSQMQGATAGVANTVFIDTNVKCTGVYGAAVVVNIPQHGGGYRQRAQIPLTITRGQISSPPAAKSRLTRLDLTPPVTYIIDYVATHDPLIYTLILVRMGE